MKKRKIAMLVMTGVLLTGCMGTNYLEEGVSQLEEKQYEEASKSFQKEIDEEKNLDEAYRGMGIAYFEMEEFEKAIDVFGEALDNGAEETATLYNFIGISNMKIENYEEAVSAFEKGMSMEDCSDTMKREMLFNTVVSYEKLGDWDNAKEKVSEYNEQYPGDSKAEKEAESEKDASEEEEGFMAEMIELKQVKEKVILVGVSTDDHDDTEKSLDELEELASTAGAVTVGRVVQNLSQIHPVTYVGKGKLDEIKDLLWETEATGIICDDELSPIQLGNMEDALNTKIMDRTLIILDIFANRASTNEGKIQVELAQLKYRQSRLVGLGKSLSRLGGGIGTRGPGEKKLEMDRRLIKGRIAHVKRHREVTREQRSRNQVPVIAIVGYTNAGKSTLLNTLTGADVLEEDKLFATLDPTTRNLKLPSKQEVLLTDTVGFIRKLPHHLIEAFKSTLEEAKYADIILHVVDASNPQMDEQMYIVYETLMNLEVKNKPVITAFNKQDKVDGEAILRDFKADHVVNISAKTGEGLENLQNVIEEVLREQKILIEQLYPYADAGKIQLIRKYGELLEEEYREEGIFAKGYIPIEIYEKVKL